MEIRKALNQALAELMREDEKICILDADLSKPNGTSNLYTEFPERCFNVGIAEANMVGIAAGLSAYGFKPVILSFAPFVTRRVCDQIAVSVAYAKQNVKIIGTDPGITAEINGGTHMSFEDVATLRSIPTMDIYDATDSTQMYQAIKQIMKTNNPCYIRTSRKFSKQVFDENYKFQLYKSDVVREGTDITVLASGIMVYETLTIIDKLKEEGISVELISVNTIKPLDEEAILKSVKKTNHLVTCENHNVIGGLYSAVSELMAEKYPIKIDKIAVMDQFGQVGKYNDLLECYHLTGNDIYDTIKKNLSK